MVEQLKNIALPNSVDIITVTQEEFEKTRSSCYNDNSIFEDLLKYRIKKYGPVKDHNPKCYERFKKAEIMLKKLEIEKV